MSVSNIYRENTLYVDTVDAVNLYAGEERWVYNAPSQTFNANTTNGTVMANWVVQSDSTGNVSNFTASTGTFTAPRNGVYEVNFTSTWDIGVSVGGYIRVIWESPTGGLYTFAEQNPTIGGTNGAAGLFKIRLTAGKQYQVLVVNGTNAAENIPGNIMITYIRP